MPAAAVLPPAPPRLQAAGGRRQQAQQPRCGGNCALVRPRWTAPLCSPRRVRDRAPQGATMCLVATAAARGLCIGLPLIPRSDPAVLAPGVYSNISVLCHVRIAVPRNKRSLGSHARHPMSPEAEGMPTESFTARSHKAVLSKIEYI